MYTYIPDHPPTKTFSWRTGGTEKSHGHTAALELHQIVQSTPMDNQGDAIYGTCLGMMSLANTRPAYIDRFLQLFLKVVDIQPDQRLNSSTTTFSSCLLMLITDIYTGGFRTHEFWPQNRTHPGAEYLLDRSMLNYTQEEVEGNLDIILRDRTLQANEANSTIAKAAIFARFTVLINQVRPSWLESYWINVQGYDTILRKSKSFREKWIRASFIAALVRVRGYAKSVSENFAKDKLTNRKMEEWQELLKRWLYDPELNKTNDLMVKHHVLLTLKNLREGPFDETSEELFRSEDWVSC